MFNKLEFSDINRYFVSIGTILIAISFLLPYFYLKENFGIIISETDYKSYTEISRKIIDNKQQNILFFQNYILEISASILLIGIIFTIIGIVRWNKRQSKIDKKFDKELEKLEIEIKQLTPEEKEEKLNEEVLQVTESSHEISTNLPAQDYRNIRNIYENVEATIINKVKQYNLSNNSYELYTEIKVANKYIDVLLKGKEKDIIVEIKYMNRNLNIMMLRDLTQRFDYLLEFYKKSTQKTTQGKMFVVYNDSDISEEQVIKAKLRFESSDFQNGLLNKTELYLIKHSELDDFEIKNII
ncbi:hypothetical protein [Empedobacter brevis]|uniref:hypothetical protein n=1 Tax=Empedobacter brevis TaxID=247 RepID=UPI003341C8A0